jgi:hypothetical protein
MAPRPLLHCRIPTPGATNGAPTPLRINISLSAGVASLSFNSVVGRTYRVEYKDDLTNATWTALGADRPGTGSTIVVTDNIAGRPTPLLSALG